MSKSRGIVLRKGYDYMRVVYLKDQDGLTTIDHTWVDSINNATVFSSIPRIFLNRSELIVEKAQISSVVTVEEWLNIKEFRPINHNDEVKILIDGQEQKALWNSNINSFVDYNSMNPINAESIFWKKV